MESLEAVAQDIDSMKYVGSCKSLSMMEVFSEIRPECYV